MLSWVGLRREFRPMLQLAAPIVLGEIGWMAMGVVDTMMTGRLSKEAMGAAGVGSSIYHVVALFGLGLLLGLDTLVSQSFGAGDMDDCNRSLIQAIYICLPLGPILMGVCWLVIPLLPLFAIHKAVLPLVRDYLHAVVWSTLPLLFYAAFRRYLQSVNVVKPVAVALVSANLVNVAANYALIFGRFGAPALGVAGAGWATTFSRLYMAAFLGVSVWLYDSGHGARLRRASLAADWRRIRQLLRLGLPAAMQITMEVAIFALVATLIASLEPRFLAAHQVALMAAATTYMVPLGIGSAAAVRVGQAIGRRRPADASQAGAAALLLGAAFMVLAGISFLVFPRWIGRAFTADESVISTAVELLAIAALFEICDGLQAVATGALRGAGDTRTPLVAHTVCYWAIGLPAGWYLCFRAGWGAAGLWVGLCLALILIGLVLLLVWRKTVRSLSA